VKGCGCGCGCGCCGRIAIAGRQLGVNHSNAQINTPPAYRKVGVERRGEVLCLPHCVYVCVGSRMPLNVCVNLPTKTRTHRQTTFKRFAKRESSHLKDIPELKCLPCHCY